MTNLVLVEAESPEELARCYPVLKELRPHLTFGDFKSLYQKAHDNDGYRLVALQSQGVIVAVMGYRFLYDFVHGKHLYVDDLVASESRRSQGLGAMLLKHAEALARRAGCDGLRLCTGIENEMGKKFYERNGWSLRAVAYKKKLAPEA